MKKTINYLKYFQKAALISETIDYSNEQSLFWANIDPDFKIDGIFANKKYKNIYETIKKSDITTDNKKRIINKFEKEINNKQSIKLLISPLPFYKDDKICHPFVIPVELKGMESNHNNITLKPTSLPIISRDFLGFFANEENMFNLEELKEVIEKRSATDIFEKGFDPEHWNYFIKYYLTTFYKFYEKRSNINLIKDKIYFFEEKMNFNFSKNYKNVIEVLKERNHNVELFDLLTKNININYKNNYDIKDMINKLENETSTSFLGQIKVNKIGKDEYYSLNRNQRIFLNALNKEQVTALNGPPGTGKTTALQSVIATKIVDSFLKQEKMPIFFGVSATNQAKDNIIEGFKYSEIHSESNDITLFNRWFNFEAENLDYGIPFAGKADAVILEVYNRFLTKEFYVSIKKQYLENNAKFSNEVRSNVFDIFDWTSRSIRNFLGLKGITKIKLIPDSFFKKVDDLTMAKMNIYKLANNVHYLLEETEEKKRRLINVLRFIEKQVHDSEHEIHEVFNWYNKQIDYVLNDFLNTFEEHQNSFYTKNNMDFTSKNIKKIYYEYEKTINEKKFLDLDIIYKEISYVIDNLFKPILFHLAMRYYEASFIIELGNVLNNKKLLNNYGVFKDNFKSEKYKLFSNISPVFVSTMNSLPKEMNIPSFYKNKGKWEKRDDYLFNFIDYLIIDEAGQCNTEKGAINFLFAKNAIVVGDTDQIEPVFSINAEEDFNARNQFFNNKIDIHEFCLEPYNTHNGNVMKMAQNVSRYSPYFNIGLSKGLYLLEHRRCRREVIEYCNELVYKNKLEYPGNDKFSDLKDSDLYLKNQKPWGFIHVEGKVEKIGTSSTNKIEANSILEWIDENYEELKSKGKPLRDVIAILTCFSAQERVIKNAIHYANFKNPSLKKELKEVTIGTAHKLQGAERPIILFSFVYDKNSIGKLNFMDRSKNIINVAVSRSKQSFYVFGDKEVLSKAKKDSSTEILWKYLNK